MLAPTNDPAVGAASQASKTQSVSSVPLPLETQTLWPAVRDAVCLGKPSLEEVCKWWAEGSHLEDCAEEGSLEVGRAKIHRLLTGLNPPKSVKAVHPLGIHGKKYWQIVSGSPAYLETLFVLEWEGRFYPIQEITSGPHSESSIEFLLAPTMENPNKLFMLRKNEHPDPADWFMTSEVAVIALEHPPRVALHQQLTLTIGEERSTSTSYIRQVDSWEDGAARFSAEINTYPPGVTEVSTPAQRVVYCAGAECPVACSEDSVGNVGREEVLSEPQISSVRAPQIEVDGPYLTLKWAKVEISCFSQMTLQANLLTCYLKGSSRSLSVGFGASDSDSIHCSGGELPEYNFIYGGSWDSTKGETTVLGSWGAQLADDLWLVLDPKSARLLISSEDASTSYQLWYNEPWTFTTDTIDSPPFWVDLTQPASSTPCSW